MQTSSWMPCPWGPGGLEGAGGGGQAPASSFPVRKLRGAWSLEWRPAQGGVRTWAKKGNLALSDSPSRAKKTLQGPRPTLPVG